MKERVTYNIDGLGNGQEQITDTDRLDFIIANDATVHTAIEPGCRCASCWTWSIDVNRKEYFSADLREAIDEAIENNYVIADIAR